MLVIDAHPEYKTPDDAFTKVCLYYRLASRRYRRTGSGSGLAITDLRRTMFLVHNNSQRRRTAVLCSAPRQQCTIPRMPDVLITAQNSPDCRSEGELQPSDQTPGLRVSYMFMHCDLNTYENTVVLFLLDRRQRNQPQETR
jgi:hypothetical protein